jgi:hypothetical protein
MVVLYVIARSPSPTNSQTTPVICALSSLSHDGHVPAPQSHFQGLLLALPQNIHLDLVPGPKLVQHSEEIFLQLDCLPLHTDDDVPQQQLASLVSAQHDIGSLNLF